MEPVSPDRAVQVLPVQALAAPGVQQQAAGACDGDAAALDAFKVVERARRKKRIRRGIVLGVLGALAAAGLVAFILQQASEIEQMEDLPDYGLDVVVRGDFETSVQGSGATRPYAQAQVTPEVEGIVAEVLVAEGDTVEAGQVVMTLKNDDLDKAIAEADQQVRAAENGVESAKVARSGAYTAYDAAVAQRNAARNAHYETQEEADAAIAQAQTQVNEAQAQTNSAELGVEEAELALQAARDAAQAARDVAAKRTVVAPAAGTVVACAAEVGQQVGGSAAAGGALVTIADLSQMRVSLQVNEVDISNLQVGQQALVGFSALPDLELPATVERIASASTGNGGEMGYDSYGGIVTYTVDLIVPEPDPRVKSGMTARATIETERIDDVLLVPEAALSFTGDDTAVLLVARDGTAAGEGVHDGEGAQQEFDEVEVRVLARDGATAAVEGPVEEGALVQVDFFGDVAVG